MFNIVKFEEVFEVSYYLRLLKMVVLNETTVLFKTNNYNSAQGVAYIKVYVGPKGAAIKFDGRLIGKKGLQVWYLGKHECFKTHIDVLKHLVNQIHYWNGGEDKLFEL